MSDRDRAENRKRLRFTSTDAEVAVELLLKRFLREKLRDGETEFVLTVDDADLPGFTLEVASTDERTGDVRVKIRSRGPRLDGVLR